MISIPECILILPNSPSLRVYVAVFTDLYYTPLPSQSINAKHTKRPSTLADFCGASRLFIGRLPNTASSAQIAAAVTCLDQVPVSTSGTTLPEYSVQVTCSDKRRSLQHEICLVAQTKNIRDELAHLLRFNIEPWSHKKDAFVKAARSIEGQSGQSDSTAMQRATAFADITATGSKLGSWVGTVVQGVAGVAGLADTAARTLGGISLVGPVLQLVALSARCATLVIQAKENQVITANLHHRLLLCAERLVKVGNVVLKSGLGDLDSEAFQEFVDDIFSTFVVCWDLLSLMERRMMDGFLKRFWNAEEMGELEGQVAKVEDELKRHRLLEALCSLDDRVRDEVAALRMADCALRKDFHASLVQMRLEGSLKEDLFSPSFATVPDLPTHIISEGASQLADLRAAILVTGASSVRTVAYGDGGVGKTTACIIVAHDLSVRTAYPGGHYFLTLGPSSSDAAVLESLSFLVEISGGIRRSAQIRRLSTGDEQISRAAALAGDWFSNRRILFILDNVWPRAGSGAGRREWAPALSVVAGGAGNAFLFSTRMPQLAQFANSKYLFERLNMSSRAGRGAAIELFEEYAGIPDLRRAGDQRFDLGNPSYIAAREKIVSFCAGWQIAFVMAGPLASQMGYEWEEIMECLQENMLAPGGVAAGTLGNDGLHAIMAGSLTYLDEVARKRPSDPLFNGVDLDALLQRFGEDSFQGSYAALAVFDAPRSVEVPALAVMLGVSEKKAAAFARLLNSMGLANVTRQITEQASSVKSVLYLSLHDLQYVFAERLCGTEGVPSLKHQHRALIADFARKIGEPVGAEIRTVNWSVLDRESTSSWCKYIRHRLLKHLVAAVDKHQSSDGREDGVHVQQDMWWRNSIRDILTDYRWIQFRGKRDGRSSLLQDWAVVLSSKAGDNAARHKFSAGEWNAVQTVYEVLQSIGAEEYRGDMECVTHGARDRGLAGQLYGNLNVLKFHSQREHDRRDALALVSLLKESIVQQARGPWLRPIGDCCGSVEKKDSRCTMICPAGEGPIYSLASMELDGRHIVASACQDGKVRLHDMDDDGRVLCTLSGHEAPVLGVAVARQSHAGSASILVSSSVDKTVRIWSVIGAVDGKAVIEESVKCIHVLRNEFGERVPRVSITPNGNRVIAGGAGHRNGTDESVGKYAVHIWTRINSAAVGNADVDGLTSYAYSALGGHTDIISDVCVSRDGSLVASGSHDGTVRVWRLPIASRPSGDEEPLQIIKAGLSGDQVDKIWCLSLLEDDTALLAGTEYGRALMWDTRYWKMVALAGRGDGAIAVTGVCSMTLVGADEKSRSPATARVFTGHVDGTIGEWCAASMCRLNVYGYAQSGVGHVWGLTAGRFRDGGTDGTVIQMVSGYGDGRLRSWVAGARGAISGGKSGGLESHGEYIEKSFGTGDRTSCISISRDGFLLARGLWSGGVDIWSSETGKFVRGFDGHKSFVHSVDFSSDSGLIASCGADGFTRVSRVEDGKCLHLLRGDKSAVNTVIFSRDDTRLITGGSNGKIRVWLLTTGKCAFVFSGVHSGPISALAVVTESPIGSSEDPAVNIASPAKGKKFKLRCFRWKKRTVVSSVAPARQSASPHSNDVVCSRDESGNCVVWLQTSGKVLEYVRDASFDLSLSALLKDSTATPVSEGWRENTCWLIRRPEAIGFEVDGLGDAFCRDIALSRDVYINALLQLSLSSAQPDVECNCIVKILLDSACCSSSFFAFNAPTKGGNRLVLGCGMADGNVAFLEMVYG